MKFIKKLVFIPLITSMLLTGCQKAGSDNAIPKNDDVVAKMRLITRLPVNDCYRFNDQGHAFIMITNTSNYNFQLNFPEVYQVFKPTDEYFNGVKENKDFAMYRNYLDLTLKERTERANALLPLDQTASIEKKADLVVKPGQFFTISDDGSADDFYPYLYRYINTTLSKLGFGFDKIGDIFEDIAMIIHTESVSLEQVKHITSCFKELMEYLNSLIDESNENLERALQNYVPGENILIDLLSMGKEFIEEHVETLELMLQDTINFFKQIDYLPLLNVLMFIINMGVVSNVGTLTTQVFQSLTDAYIKPLINFYPENEDVAYYVETIQEMVDEYGEYGFEMLSLAMESISLIPTFTHSDKAMDVIVELMASIVSIVAEENVTFTDILGVVAQTIANIYSDDKYLPVIEHLIPLIPNDSGETIDIVAAIFAKLVEFIATELGISEHDLSNLILLLSKVFNGEITIFEVLVALQEFPNSTVANIFKNIVLFLKGMGLTNPSNYELLCVTIDSLCNLFHDEITDFFGDVIYPNAGICVNRELFDMSTSYDYGNNCIYEIDISYQQILDIIEASKGENYFGIIQHNCSTLASKFWNAALGYDENGDKTALYCDAVGTGRHSLTYSPASIEQSILGWKNNPDCQALGGRFVGVDLPNPLFDTGDNRSNLPEDPSHNEIVEDLFSSILSFLLSY